jgi:hypothetical protein
VRPIKLFYAPMTPRPPVLLLLLALTLPAAAQPLVRGEVIIETVEHSAFGTTQYHLFSHTPGQLFAFPTVFGDLPFEIAGPAPLRAAGNSLFLGDGRTIYFWRGAELVPVLQDGNEISEIAPMRNGNFLAAARFGPALIEFNLGGRVREHDFPGAEHIELLADQCTLLYSRGSLGDAVHRMNLCTGEQLADFATLGTGYAGAVRQLPGGDILVADGRGVSRYTAHGSFVRFYAFSGATHIALIANGTAFYAAGIAEGIGELRTFDVDHPAHVQTVVLAGPRSHRLVRTDRVTDLMVAGEWRASAPAARRRSVRQ